MDSATTLSTFNRPAALRQARAILRHHGKSYYYSTCLFPRELQNATCAVYAFVRLPDEIVDNSPTETPEDLRRVKTRLLEFQEEWRRAYQSGQSSEPVLQLAAQTWHDYKIPYEYSEEFLAAMIQDTVQTDYADYADLEGYMYGSAAVIGLMMSHLVGFERPETLEHAKKLGYAMQLTNFLRDIDEDFQLRGRVYMPADELARFGLSRDDIAARQFSPDFRAFVEFQAARCHRLYEEANQGIPFLKPEGRFAVATASTLYRAILGKLEAQDWNPFAGRAKTSFPEKLVLTGKAWQLSRGAVK
ncbi:MAG TPA: phytoene/squalene synthase family protein [Abditibacterium sp.]|jgi:phytoene synthase